MNGTDMSKTEAVERLEAIRIEIENLVLEAVDTIEEAGFSMEVKRANVYWKAHIVGALREDEETCGGGSMPTLTDAIKAIETGDESLNECWRSFASR